MSTPEYEYDVAFSFVAKDETIATQLADQFEGRLKYFLYSRKQEQLAGTDGEKTFNEVFSKQARLVVVLYRDGWGSSPWTRIEETAIRNRAFEEGYDFVVFIPLDDNPTVPKWLPRSQLWIGLNRWGISGAASVIDARVQELGGAPTTESIEHRAARVERAVTYEKRREAYLTTDGGVRSANQSFSELSDSILASVPSLQAAAPSLQIAVKQQERQIILLSSGPALSVSWRLRYINTLHESVLDVSVWQGHPPFPGISFYAEPQSIGSLKISPDLDPSDTHAWAVQTPQGKRLLSGKDAAEHIISWWLEKYAMPKKR